MEGNFTYYACSNIGVSGTTEVVVRKTERLYEARMGIALLGSCNMTEEEYARAENNPFHPDFHDNMAVGTGKTEAEAIEAMKNDLKSISDSLFS